jgi:hypothetical protein
VKSTSWPTADTTGTGQATILDRSAAAPHDDHVDARHLAQHADGGGDVGRRVFALDARRPDQHARVRRPAPQHFQDVAQRRAVERGHDPDPPRQGGQRALSLRIEQPFGLQPLLQLLERQLQRAQAVRLHVLADDLVFTFRLVDAETAARDDVQTVFGLEAQIAHRRPEHDGLDLRAAILQREIHVPGIPHLAVRDLPLEPDLAELRLDQRADAGRQLADRIDATFEAGRGGRRILRRGFVLIRDVEEIGH